MIDIKDISGQVRFSVPITENSIFVEELMKSDYIQLSWNSDTGETMPAGSYIEYNGEIYRLLEPYFPSMENEAKYIYSPKFQSRIMSWDKQITPVYTYEEDGTTVKTREMDWTFTGSPVDAMYIIKQAIKNETGELWNVELASELPATISIQSQSSSIFSVLNTIANECDTEWWADKKTNILYLSKCVHGEPVTLEVGENIQVPSVTNSGEGYFTRFYAFGSTRNIVQSSTEGNASVNKRLTLDPAKYPNGYKDIRQGLKQSEIFVKVLYFDHIYPSSKLTISDVRARLRYRLDNSGNKIKIGGTDEEPIYEQYAIWYFQIAGFDFNPDTRIEGLNLSASFESGQLAGRDFELTYYKEGRKVSDNNDVTPFEIKAGDYEIIIDETSGQIIPGVAYIIPQEGDSVVLYNIEMPAEYTSSAQAELEAELDKAMASYKEDNNTYQMSSDPTRFYSEETDIKMGQAITFINGLQTLSTRAMMVEKRLDLPCYQTIKVGNKIIKGNTQELKEEVANANQSIDVINAFNELSKSLSQAYANAQREMIEGFARIGNMWKFDTENENTIYTEFNAYSKGELAAGGFSAGGGGGETGGGGIDENKLWQILAKEGTQQINKSHITTALGGYATEQWVLQKGYITSAALNGYATQGWVTNNFVTTGKLTEQLSKYVTLTALSEQLSKYVTLEVFNPFKETVDAHISNNNIHLTAEEKEKLSWFAKDKDGNIYVTNGLNFYTEGELSAGGFSDEGGSGTGGLFGIIVNGETYSPVDGYITIPNYPTSLKWGDITGKPSTIEGYGIKDAYTKTESDGRYVTIGTSQTIAGTKTFTASPWLTGGTAINIINKKESNATGLFWKNADDRTTMIGGIGMLSLDGVTPISFYMGWGTDPWATATNFEVSSGYIRYKGQNILHTGNYTSTLDTRYVKKSGDTMTGALTIAQSAPGIILNRDGNLNPYIRFTGGDLNYGEIGVEPDGNLVFWPVTSSAAGAGKWNKVWHAGNDGSGSGLDADLLDGAQGTSYLADRGLLTGADWNNYNYNGAWRTAPEEWGSANTPKNANSSVYTYGLLATLQGGSTRVQMYFPHSDDGVYTRITWDGSVSQWRAWKVLATTASNVASATKLQTPRTIWGQSFDGTANVSGSMTGVGDITSTGFYLRGYNSTNPLLKLSNTNVSAAYIQLTTSGVLSMDFGSESRKNVSIVYSTGNVGVGTISPSYKLHVDGTFYASGAATLGSTLSVAGRLSANGSIYTTDISGNGSALYLGNSGNNSYVYLREDMKASSGNWSIATSGAAYFMGNVGIKTSSPAYALDVRGDISTNASQYINGIRVYKDTDGYLCIQGNLKITGNVAAAGEVAAGSPLASVSSFLYDVTSFDSYSSTSTTQAPTARAVKLIKDKVSEAATKASQAASGISLIDMYLTQITSSTTLDQLKTILMNLANAI